MGDMTRFMDSVLLTVSGNRNILGGLTKENRLLLDTILLGMLEVVVDKLINLAGGPIHLEHGKEAMKQVFPVEIFSYGDEEGKKSVDQFTQVPDGNQFQRTGCVLPSHRIHFIIQKRSKFPVNNEEVSVYITSFLEYLICEIIEVVLLDETERDFYLITDSITQKMILGDLIKKGGLIPPLK